MTSLFMTQREDAQGILDIGKHCFKCQRLDFLPFPCEFCNHTYCSDHRTLVTHNCPGKRPQKLREFGSVDSRDSKEPVASLFPNRKNDMKKVDESLSKPPKPTSIYETQFKVGEVAKTTSNAFQKFAKFLQKAKSSKSSKSIALENVALRRDAKGDAKIQPSDRVYVWVKNIENSKRDPIFVNRNWPTGRALDVIADLLKIKNNNNSTTNQEERLNMFLTSKSGDPVLIKTNERCSTFKNGDEIFLVRGTI